MATYSRKTTLAASVAFIALFTAACGTSNSNFNPPDDNGTTTGTVTGGTGSGTTTGGTTTSTGGNTSQLTGGFTGLTPQVAVSGSASPSPVTLTASNQLSSASSTQTGGNQAVSELLGPLDLGTLGVYTMAVQGFGLTNQGQLTFVPQTPDTTTPGTGNIVITGDTANSAVKVTDAYPALLGSDGSIFVADQVRSANLGRLLRVTGVSATGANVAVLTTTLNAPISLAQNGNSLYVAQYVAQGSGGQGGGGSVRRIDLTTGTVSDLVTNLQYPSSIVFDQGRNFLYIAENGNGASSGAQGGVLRIDLATFVAGSAYSGTTPSAGVTPIPVTAGDAAYVNPYDLAIDGNGNVVISEGLTLNWSQASIQNAQISQGSIRVIPAGGTASKLVQTGMTATRGLTVVNEGSDSVGQVVTAFFTEGSPGSQNSSVRQLMFRVTDGAIYRNNQIDNGQFSPLGTAYDPGTSSRVRSLKYGTGFLVPTQGQVRDLR